MNTSLADIAATAVIHTAVLIIRFIIEFFSLITSFKPNLAGNLEAPPCVIRMMTIYLKRHKSANGS